MKTNHFLSLMAIFAMLLALFACSSNSNKDDDESQNGAIENLSSSSSSSNDDGSSNEVIESSSSNGNSLSNEIIESSSSNGDGSSNEVTEELGVTLRAEPVAASNSEPVILDYFTIEDKNWYIIDAGYIRNSFVSSMTNILGYAKGSTPISFSWTTTSQSSVTKNMTETVSNSVLVSETSGVKSSLETAIKTGIKAGISVKDIFEVESSLETTIKRNTEMSMTLSVSNGRSTETSMSSIISHSESLTNTTSFTIGNNNEATGYYRYALYTISDVYFVISTSLNNQELLSWDVISCARENAYLEKLDYSPNGTFDNSPIGNEIIFAKDFHKNLPIPTTTKSKQYTLTVSAEEGGTVSRSPNQITYDAGARVTVTATPHSGYIFDHWIGAPDGINVSSPSITFSINSDVILTANFRNELVKKTKDTLYTTAGDHTYTFNKGFPAIIEVYVLGGGGGGQGGHNQNSSLVVLCKDGVGGGGGGGGAAYMKLSVEESASFAIKVGNGGEGGNPSNNSSILYWNSGESGKDGGSTSVTWAAKGITLTANGGIRGGHNRTGAGSNNSGGGLGGDIGTSPTNVLLLDWSSGRGGSGSDGEDRSCNGGGGGRAATIIGIGSIDQFGGDSRGSGGNGGCYNNNGSSGLPGQVLIVATWYE